MHNVEVQRTEWEDEFGSITESQNGMNRAIIFKEGNQLQLFQMGGHLLNIVAQKERLRFNLIFVK